MAWYYFTLISLQRELAQIDFIPKPLNVVNYLPSKQPYRYRTAAQRLKSIQAKVDTGICRRPAVPTDKENVSYITIIYFLYTT